MGFVARLVIFALGLSVLLGGYRIVEKVRGPEPRRGVVVDLADAEAAPAMPRPAHEVEIAVVEPPAAIAAPAAPAVVEMPATPDVALPPLRAGEVRILTTNRAAFMALRDDYIVAGLSDSLRRHIQLEMKRELSSSKAEGVGAAIGKVVVEGVSKFLGSEITVPVSDIRDIRYDGRKIVIRYRNGEPRGINLETIKSDGDRTLLEQFAEQDARRFVQAVKVRVK